MGTGHSLRIPLFLVLALRNGVKIPILGIGTSPFGSYDHESMVYALKDCNYRHIDTAEMYGSEPMVGEDIKASGVPREELFITTKVWPTSFGYDSTKEAFSKSCDKLQTDYIDLYLIHWPVDPKAEIANTPETRQHHIKLRADTWRAMEELHKQGKCRAIGVSNFEKHHFEPLLETAEIVPMVNQIELNPMMNPKELLKYHKEKDIVVEAYCPLARGKILDNPTIVQIAEAHRKTTAQVCIRWLLQKGIVTIPKSIKKHRVKENSQVFDFQLSDGEMQTLETLNSDLRVLSADSVNLPW